MARMFEDLKTGLTEIDHFLGGKGRGYKVTIPAEIDVKSIRKGLNMTQTRFSDAFGFSLDAVKHWEGGRRTPEASARAFLTVIAKNPKAVIAALRSSKSEGIPGTYRPASTNTRRRTSRSPAPVSLNC